MIEDTSDCYKKWIMNNNFVVFIPYGSRLGFHENGVASTMANIDYKFPQCVCYEVKNGQCEMHESVGSSKQTTISD